MADTTDGSNERELVISPEEIERLKDSISIPNNIDGKLTVSGEHIYNSLLNQFKMRNIEVYPHLSPHEVVDHGDYIETNGGYVLKHNFDTEFDQPEEEKRQRMASVLERMIKKLISVFVSKPIEGNYQK